MDINPKNAPKFNQVNGDDYITVETVSENSTGHWAVTRSGIVFLPIRELGLNQSVFIAYGDDGGPAIFTDDAGVMLPAKWLRENCYHSLVKLGFDDDDKWDAMIDRFVERGQRLFAQEDGESFPEWLNGGAK